MHRIRMVLAVIAFLAASAAAAQNSGRWAGEAWLREARMPMELELRQEGGEIAAELMLPDLVWRAEVDAAAVAGGVEVTMPFGLGPVRLLLAEGGHVLASPADGLRITLRRIPDIPYRTEEVEIGSSAGPLPATLYVPGEAAAVPGVVLAGGALAESRHHPSVTAWCHHFVRRRIACLVADRMPDGAGDGADLARDADQLAEAVAWLRGRNFVAADRVGIAGFSRGNWPAVRVAAADPGVAFLLLVAPPAFPPAETEAISIGARMEAAGRPDEEIAQAQRYYELYFATAAGERPWRDLDRAARAVEGTVIGEFLDQPLRPADLAFWRRNGRFDNAADFPRIRAPVLAVWGEEDLVVPPEVHQPRLRAALRSTPSIETLVLPAADHSIERQPGPNALGVWRWPSRAPRLLAVLDEWLLSVAGRAE